MVKWLFIIVIIGLFMGVLFVFFLKSFIYVIDVCLVNFWLFFIFFISGVVFMYFYMCFGKNVS